MAIVTISILFFIYGLDKSLAIGILLMLLFSWWGGYYIPKKENNKQIKKLETELKENQTRKDV